MGVDGESAAWTYAGNKINFSSPGTNKLQLESEKSIFNLNCINASEFPLTEDDFNFKWNPFQKSLQVAFIKHF